MADLGFPVALGSLGATLGIGAAVLSPGGDARKLSQIAGLTVAGAGLGMALDPAGDDVESVAGIVAMVLGTGLAVFGGVGS
jgi:hypothetical protein